MTCAKEERGDSFFFIVLLTVKNEKCFAKFMVKRTCFQPTDRASVAASRNRNAKQAFIPEKWKKSNDDGLKEMLKNSLSTINLLYFVRELGRSSPSSKVRVHLYAAKASLVVGATASGMLFSHSHC